MRTIPSWDQYYLDICKVVAARSKDPEHPDRLRDRRSESRNPLHGLQFLPARHPRRRAGAAGAPHQISVDRTRRAQRICNAARAGTATEGCTIYVEIMPCMDCARAIVQAGIVAWWFRRSVWRNTPATTITSTSAWRRRFSREAQESKSAACVSRSCRPVIGLRFAGLVPHRARQAQASSYKNGGGTPASVTAAVGTIRITESRIPRGTECRMSLPPQLGQRLFALASSTCLCSCELANLPRNAKPAVTLRRTALSPGPPVRRISTPAIAGSMLRSKPVSTPPAPTSM